MLEVDLRGVKNRNNRQNWTHLISNDSKFVPRILEVHNPYVKNTRKTY